MFLSPGDSTKRQLGRDQAPERIPHECHTGASYAPAILHSTHFHLLSEEIERKKKSPDKLAPLSQLFGFERHAGSEETVEEFTLK